MPDLLAAVTAAARSLPPSRTKDITPGSVCPYCNQVVIGGGGVEGGEVPEVELELEHEEGEEGTPSPRSPRPAKTPARVAAFLAALREYPLPRRAARAAGVALRTLYDWRQADPEFHRQWIEAHAEGVERLEERAHTDALHGSDREATLQRMFVIKRHRPEYRDNVTVRHEGGRGSSQDAALLRRAMVEALAPYPEARAALAAHLARLATGQAGGVPRLRADVQVPAGELEDVIDAELVEVADAEETEGETATSARGRAADAPGGGGAAAVAAGPVRMPPTSSISPKKDHTHDDQDP